LSNAVFLKVLIVGIALSLTYGVAFGGGVLYGRSSGPEQGADASTVWLLAPTAAPDASTAGQPPVLNFTPDDVNAFRQQLREQFGGELPPQLEARLDQFRDGGSVDLGQLAVPVPGGQLPDGGQLPQGGRLGTGGARGGQTGGAQGGFTASAGGVAGKITTLSTSQITLETAQGSVSVAVGAETTVQDVSASTVASLKQGDDITVRGQRQQDGTIRAVAITRQTAP
jgi:hypothetical protein